MFWDANLVASRLDGGGQQQQQKAANSSSSSAAMFALHMSVCLFVRLLATTTWQMREFSLGIN